MNTKNLIKIVGGGMFAVALLFFLSSTKAQVQAAVPDAGGSTSINVNLVSGPNWENSVTKNGTMIMPNGISIDNADYMIDNSTSDYELGE